MHKYRASAVSWSAYKNALRDSHKEESAQILVQDPARKRPCGPAFPGGDLTIHQNIMDPRWMLAGIAKCGFVGDRFRIKDHQVGPHADFHHTPVLEAEFLSGEGSHFADPFRQGQGLVFPNVLAQDPGKGPVDGRGSTSQKTRMMYRSNGETPSRPHQRLKL